MKDNDCPICRHVERSRIDHAIAEGRPDSYLTSHFAADPDSIRWHKENCLASDPAAGQINALAELRETAHRIALAAAENEKAWRVSLAAMTVASRLLMQESKLAERKRPPKPQLAESIEWQKLKSRIILALDPFPEARAALAEALQDET